MTGYRDIEIARITVGERLGSLSEVKLVALNDLIEEFGFTVPITVRPIKGGYKLIDGGHRLEIMRRRGATTIPSMVTDKREDEARAMEAAQNLVAGGASVLKDAVFLAAMHAAYEKLHPETAQGAAGALAKHGVQGNFSSFAELTAESRGVTVRQVRKLIAAGRALSPDQVRALEVAPNRVGLVDLASWSKADPKEQSDAIRRFAAGEVRKLAQALKPAKVAEKDPLEEAFNALRKAWDHAPEPARRRFVAEHHAALSARVREEAERRVIAGKLGVEAGDPAVDRVKAGFGPRAGKAAS